MRSPCCRRSAGRTNALVHLTAVARRLGIEIDLQEFDAIGRKAPVLVDLKPSGDHYMEHFHWAGGNSRLMREIPWPSRREVPHGRRSTP